MKSESILVLAIVVLLAPSASAGTYSGGGDGSAENPYKIATPNDMNEIGTDPNDWDKHFLLTADINLADYTGTQFNIIGPNFTTPFTGVFDGNGHTVSNFTYTCTETDYIAIFGCVYDPNAEINNLHLTEPNVNAELGSSVGSLVGLLAYGTVSGCSAEQSAVSAKGRDVGGLVGSNYLSTIKNCYANGSVSGGFRWVGGLVGNNGGIIKDSWSAGEVIGEDIVGGLAGSNGEIFGIVAKVENCYSNTNVTATDSYAGGLVGINYRATVESSYATGCVDGNTGAGGLVGMNYDANISNCYAIGSVDANLGVGGLVGADREGLIENCYAVGEVLGNEDVGGLLGREYDSNSVYIKNFWNNTVNPSLQGIGNAADSNVIGESTVNMQIESTFVDAGWDFVEIWNIGENQTYPFLRAYPAGDLNHSGRVDFVDFAIFASHWLEGTEQ